MPLSAIINGERIIGPDLSDDEWSELKLQSKKGQPIIMTCCGLSGHMRKSKNGLKHFYHAHKSEECGGEPESKDHLKLKYLIYQICKSEGWWVQPEYQSTSGDWRADIYTAKDDKKLVFEVQLSIIDLDELKQREKKYRRDGIESYWILKDYLKIHPYDDPKTVVNGDSCIFVESYINEGDFSLEREQLFLLKHGIRAIGINLEHHYLYTSDIIAIDISDWVKSTLRGDYENELKKFEITYKKKVELKEMAKPELDKLFAIGQRRFEYEDAMKRIYACFKSNKWEDRLSLQQDIRDMYSSFDTFNKSFGKTFSSYNGFVWNNYPQSERKYPTFNLESEIQIVSLHNLIINLENVERNFLSIFNFLNEYIEKNDKIIQLFCSNKT